MTDAILPTLTAGGLTAAIQSVRARYHAEGSSDWDIGNGLCEDFAFDVLELCLGEDWSKLDGAKGSSFATWETFQIMIDLAEWDWPLIDRLLGNRAPSPDTRAAWDIVATEMYPMHVWIEFEGRCYDCEHPDGVSSFFELNFFRRKFDEALSMAT